MPSRGTPSRFPARRMGSRWCSLTVNATFCTWLEMRPKDLIGRRLVVLLTDGGRIYHETHYAPMLRMQGFVREIAVDVLRVDGSRPPTLLNASLLTSPDGVPCVVRVAVFDATERRAYEPGEVRARRPPCDMRSVRAWHELILLRSHATQDVPAQPSSCSPTAEQQR
jgi:hypothetical protein